MGDIRLLEKIRTYDKKWCYQYQKRLDTLKEDMELHGWNEDDLKKISLDDFEFSPITEKSEKADKKESAPAEKKGDGGENK